MVREHGRALAPVADILGHADVKTTSHYARSDLEDRRAALEDLAEQLHSHADAQLLSGAGGTDPIVPSFHETAEKVDFASRDPVGDRGVKSMRPI